MASLLHVRVGCFVSEAINIFFPCYLYIGLYCAFSNEIKGNVSATPLFLFTSGDDYLNCSK